jgi:DNA polymerase zeta
LDREYFFFSPSLEDTNKQEALEVQALTLEPESGHIEDPVVVCDFTALYPSLVIAYNLCFSTCAGQLEYHSTRAAMGIQGRTTGKVGPMSYSEDRTATALKHHFKSTLSENLKKNRIYTAPSRSMFVCKSVVKGVLPQVLDELLSTRAMLKKAAKQYKKSVPKLAPAILRQLEARQLALKYVGTSNNAEYGTKKFLWRSDLSIFLTFHIHSKCDLWIQYVHYMF